MNNDAFSSSRAPTFRRAHARTRGGLRARIGFVMLALASLALLGLQPLCDALSALPGGDAAAMSVAHDAGGRTHPARSSDSSGVCCSTIGGGTLLAPLALTRTTGGSGPQLGLIAVATLLAGTGLLSLGARRFSGASLGARPYCSRSARILR